MVRKQAVTASKNVAIVTKSLRSQKNQTRFADAISRRRRTRNRGNNRPRSPRTANHVTLTTRSARRSTLVRWGLSPSPIHNQKREPAMVCQVFATPSPSAPNSPTSLTRAATETTNNSSSSSRSNRKSRLAKIQ